MTCTNDLSPIIIAVAVQIPLVCGAVIAWIRYKTDQSKQKERSYKIIGQNDKLLYIIENGFHGPPGMTGARGETGKTGPAGAAAPDPIPLPPSSEGQQ